jgi:hypothetical protein
VQTVFVGAAPRFTRNIDATLPLMATGHGPTFRRSTDSTSAQ